MTNELQIAKYSTRFPGLIDFIFLWSWSLLTMLFLPGFYILGASYPSNHCLSGPFVDPPASACPSGFSSFPLLHIKVHIITHEGWNISSFYLTDASTLFLEKRWTQGTIQPSPQILNNPDATNYLPAAVSNTKLFLENGGRGEFWRRLKAIFFPALMWFLRASRSGKCWICL